MRSPKAKYRMEINFVKPLDGVGSVMSFNDDSIDALKHRACEMVKMAKCAAHIVIMENKASYPKFDWQQVVVYKLDKEGNVNIPEVVVYEVRDSEAGNVIDTFATRQEAEAALKAYEKSDEEEGIYTPDFYEVHPRCLSEREMIGKRIAAIRNELGLSQQDVADRVGMAQPHIARIEAGKYSVGIDILGKIAAALGKRVDLVD